MVPLEKYGNCLLYTSELQVVSSRVHKSLLLLKLEGVDTVEEADALRGRILYLNLSLIHI